MIRINLLPTKAARRKETVFIQLIVGVVALVAMALFCYWQQGQMEAQVAEQKRIINGLNGEINQLKSIIGKVQRYKRKRRDLETKINTIKQLNARRSGPVRLMEEFTYVLPRKAWITQFREVNKQLTLEGQAVDGPTVADFIDALRESKFFNRVQLIQVSQQNQGGKPVQKFNITCRVRYRGGR